MRPNYGGNNKWKWAEPVKKLFILYDERARGGDTDDANVLVAAHSEFEIKNDNRSFRGQNGAWFEYDIEGEELVNERRRADLDTL